MNIRATKSQYDMLKLVPDEGATAGQLHELWPASHIQTTGNLLRRMVTARLLKTTASTMPKTGFIYTRTRRGDDFLRHFYIEDFGPSFQKTWAERFEEKKSQKAEVWPGVRYLCPPPKERRWGDRY